MNFEGFGFWVSEPAPSFYSFRDWMLAVEFFKEFFNNPSSSLISDELLPINSIAVYAGGDEGYFMDELSFFDLLFLALLLSCSWVNSFVNYFIRFFFIC